jgi:hypothetical protein
MWVRENERVRGKEGKRERGKEGEREKERVGKWETGREREREDDETLDVIRRCRSVAVVVPYLLDENVHSSFYSNLHLEILIINKE